MKKVFIIALAVVLIAAVAVTLIACTKENPNDNVCGGWSEEDTELTEDELAIFNDAMSKEVVDTQFIPKSIIGRQVVAGMNYKFLCTAGEGEGADQFVVQIFHDLEGENSVTSIYEY